MPRINVEQIDDVGPYSLTFDDATDPYERGVEVTDEFYARAKRITEEHAALMDELYELEKRQEPLDG